MAVNMAAFKKQTITRQRVKMGRTGRYRYLCQMPRAQSRSGEIEIIAIIIDHFQSARGQTQPNQNIEVSTVTITLVEIALIYCNDVRANKHLDVIHYIVLILFTV